MVAGLSHELAYSMLCKIITNVWQKKCRKIESLIDSLLVRKMEFSLFVQIFFFEDFFFKGSKTLKNTSLSEHQFHVYWLVLIDALHFTRFPWKVILQVGLITSKHFNKKCENIFSNRSLCFILIPPFPLKYQELVM